MELDYYKSTEKDVYEKYPMLKNMSIIDLVMMRHEAIAVNDNAFKLALDILLKHKQTK